jgi:hypothetical protein
MGVVHALNSGPSAWLVLDMPSCDEAGARFSFEPLGAKHVTELQAGDRGELTMVHANQWSAKLCVRARFLRATGAGIPA